MAKLRQLGQLATLLLKQHLDDVQAREQNQMISDRQLSLANEDARLQRETDRQRASNEAANIRLRGFTESPTAALGALQEGDQSASPFVLRDSAVLSPGMEMIAKAKEMKDLPSMAAAFGARKPGIITNLSPVTEMYNALQSQQKNIEGADKYTGKLESNNAYNSAFGAAQGKSDENYFTMGQDLERRQKEGNVDNGVKLAFERNMSPVLKGREQDRVNIDTQHQRDLNPILADRSFNSALQSSLGTQQGQAQFQVTDPSMTGLAKQVVDNPDLLDKFSPGDRMKVLRRVNAMGMEMPNEARKKADEMISAAEKALDGLEKMNLNAAYGQPAFTDLGGYVDIIPGVDGGMAGSARESVREQARQLVATMTLPRLEVMRGLGQLSDGDMKVLQATVSILGNFNISDANAREAIQVARKTLQDARARNHLAPNQSIDEKAVAKDKLNQARAAAGR